MAEITDLLPKRSVEDILAERIRVSVGGREFILPSLNLDDTEAWLGSINGEAFGLLGLLDESEDIGSVLATLAASPAKLLDLLRAYDKGGVLPPIEELRQGFTPMGLLRTVLEVWRAANPLADITLAGLTSELGTIASPPPTSSRRRNGAKPPVRSGAN